MEYELVLLLKAKKTRLIIKIRDIKEDDGTYFGEGSLDLATKQLRLVEDLLLVFNDN